jgi:hypothetical protein
LAAAAVHLSREVFLARGLLPLGFGVHTKTAAEILSRTAGLRNFKYPFWSGRRMGFLSDIANRVKSDASYRASQEVSNKINSGITKATTKSSDTKCPSCKAKNDAGVKFCASCGAKLILTCSKCSTDYPLGTKFCTADGTKL